MPTNVSIKAHWPHPGQQATGKDHLRGGLISVRTVTTVADMLALCQSLLGDSSADRTGLRRTTGIDFYVLNTGPLCLVFQYGQELAPASIRHRTRAELVVLDIPLMCKLSTGDPAVAASEFGREHGKFIAAGVSNFGVKRGHLLTLLLAVRPAGFLSRKTALFNSQPFKNFLERLQGRLMIAGVIGHKGFQTKIESNDWLVAGYSLNIRQLTGGDDIPLATLTLERDGLDLTLDFPVQVDANQFVTNYSGAIANTRVGETVEAITAFEPWIAWLLARLDPAKERLKSFVQLAQRSLGTAEVETGKEGVDRPLSLEPGGLISVLDRLLFAFPDHLALFQAGVVEAAVRLQGNLQFPGLVDIGLKPELVSAEHLLTPQRVRPLHGLNFQGMRRKTPRHQSRPHLIQFQAKHRTGVLGVSVHEAMIPQTDICLNPNLNGGKALALPAKPGSPGAG